MDEDAFLVGPDRHAAYLEGEVEQLLDVDDVFAKNLTTVLRDYSLDETDVWGRSPSAVAEGYEFAEQIGRASCREREGLRVDLGGGRMIKKKKKQKSKTTNQE